MDPPVEGVMTASRSAWTRRGPFPENTAMGNWIRAISILGIVVGFLFAAYLLAGLAGFLN